MFRDLVKYSVLTDEADGLTPQIPSHWERRRLGSMFSRRGSGTTPQGDGYYGGAIPFVLTGDLRDGVIRTTVRTVTHDAVSDHSALKVYPQNTLLVAMYTATMGRTALLGVEAACNQASCAFYSPRHGVDVRFAQLATQVSRPLLIMASAGGVQANVNAEKVGRLLLPLPPIDEQAAIVKYLGHAHARIDRAIAAKRKLIALLEEQKQSIIHQAVTRGLDPSVKVRESGIPWLGEIPAHWDTMPLSRCFASMVYGTSDNARGDGPVTVIGMGDIRAGEVRVSGNGGLNAVPAGLELEPGDLLFNRTNSPNLVGKVGLYRNERSDSVTFASYLVRLRPLPGFSSQWLVALLNSPAFLRFAQGQALVSLHQANLNPRRYGRLTIPVPPVNERPAIAAALERAISAESTTIATISREIDLLREFRTRLTSDVVTGQVDVREIAATLPELTDEAIDSAAEEFDDTELIDAELEFAGANE